MRAAYEKLTIQIGQQLASTDTHKQQLIYLINCFDTVLGALVQCKIENADRKRFQKLVNENMDQYVDLELKQYFGKLITYVNTVEPAIAAISDMNEKKQKVNMKDVEVMAKDFDQNWKNALSTIHVDATRNFGNLLCGKEVMKSALVKALTLYTKLVNIVDACYGSSPTRTTIINDQKVMHEFKKFAKDFT